MKKLNQTIAELMDRRFGHDNLIALATTFGTMPQVRAVNTYYENGSFYIITHALSGKMQQLRENPNAAICGAACGRNYRKDCRNDAEESACHRQLNERNVL